MLVQGTKTKVLPCRNKASAETNCVVVISVPVHRLEVLIVSRVSRQGEESYLKEMIPKMT